MAETVLVTGGSGYIASWCIVGLLQQGYTVRTTVRSLAREPAVRAAIGTVVDPGNRLTFYAAELTKDEGWDEAVAGCDYVLHVASPLGVGGVKDPNELVVPAREGALRVLRAATKAGVKRVVLTSSVAAASPPYGPTESLNDETVWTNPDDRNIDAYRLSKTLAERAAWEFMGKQTGPTTLTTVLPSMVVGPVLSSESLGSVQVVQRLMNGSVPGTPRIGFTMVDVRDVADLHIRAMTSPAAAGQRFIAAGEFMWMADIARTLRDRLGARAPKVPKRRLPDFVVRLIGLFDATLRQVAAGLGQKRVFTAAKAKAALGWTSRPSTDAVVDCAESLIAKGAV
ncbi:MAG TPA: aldehyde reductase [Reyranella sp.]|nr:aldehyde reductase [Reyranella sp.]